ncbi:Uncharacterized membrane protein, DUF485 family [Amycolatopsis pretoriensis]|uniref:Uncharacterized membrane protein, DUF485 family n=1 Tax=Amycolatopsis pretoriensis TaxID=218821 RepID=A0A1H5QPA7_9PSEU|nr:DUF485 domain-containing protein [Amycolatopsis pretoriensis]SEF27674.1 Uncharacterized membrane protein, DUF485 family [Amycolatopsis pretoriensis]
MASTDEIAAESATDWDLVRSGPEFTELRRRMRRFVVPVTAVFSSWYVGYVLLADFAHGFMATKLLGNLNVGLVLGILQFASTFLITGLYLRYAAKKLDPLAERIRAEHEGAGDE